MYNAKYLMKKLILIFLFLLLISTNAFAQAVNPASPYAPGQTLDPSCPPDLVNFSNCFVQMEIQSANNGLTVVGNNVGLGGTLNQNTILNLGANTLSFSNGDILFSSHPKVRDDSVLFVPSNFLYTNSLGKLLSAPVSFLLPKWYAENAAAPTIAPVATGLGSIAFGHNAQALHGGMFVFGENAGNGSINTVNSNFLGYKTGFNAVNSMNSNFFGENSGFMVNGANNSNFLGKSSGNSANLANNSNFFGQSAGSNASNASQSNFFGQEAGQGANNASYSNLLGYRAGKSFPLNTIGSNNIIIGTNISLPSGSANAINLGGILFGTGTHSDISITPNPSIGANPFGKIGIGVVTPLDTLQVFGDARVGTLGSNGCIKNFAGTGITGTCSSDENLKTNITDLSELLPKFNKIRFITYNWNETARELYSNNTQTKNIGTTAQSVQAQFPELVFTDSKGFKVVDYSGLLMYGMEAVKEVSQKFNDLINGILVATNLKSERIETKLLCVEDVCVTKQQFMQMIQSSGQTPTIITSPVAIVTPDPVVVVPPVVETEPAIVAPIQ
jgi:Chaperone of endosialidase